MTYLLALILFYANYTGEPYYRLIERNWGQDTSHCWIQPQHRVQFGDLNTDGIVDSNDLGFYSAATGQYVGWAITDVGHLEKDCRYVAGKPVNIKPVRRICLTCVARRITE